MATARSKTGGRSTKAAGAPSVTADMRVVVLHGAESFLISELTRQLRASLVEAHGEAEQFEFNGERVEAVDVLDELRTHGLIQRHKLVIVDAADKFLAGGGGKVRERIERYCEKPMAESTLLLRSSRWNAGKLDKLIAKIGTVIKCETPNAATAAEWCVGRAAEPHGKALKPATAASLVERVGPSLAHLDTELAKLAALAGDAPEITIEHIRAIAPLSREEVAWSLQRPLLEGKAGDALTLLDELIGVARAPTELLFFAMLDSCRKLHDGAALVDDGQRNVRGPLRLWGADANAIADAIVAAAQRLRPAQRAALLHDAVRTQQRARSGDAMSDRLALETLAVRVAVRLGHLRRPATAQGGAA